MKLFLDASVLLAACGSAKGSSRAIFHLAPAAGWTLVSSPYAVNEVMRNLPKLPAVSNRILQLVPLGSPLLSLSSQGRFSALNCQLRLYPGNNCQGEFTIEGEVKGAALRALFTATVRAKAEDEGALVDRVRQREGDWLQALQQPTDADRAAHLYHAVTPLFAAIVS